MPPDFCGIKVNNRIKIWDVLTRQEIVEFPHTDPFSSVAFSPDGATVAAAASNAIILWDVAVWTGPRPHGLEIISGNGQQGALGDILTRPLIVEVRDQSGNPMTGVSVTFTVTGGGGALSDTTATTGANGRASTTLRLGRQPGTNTVVATVSDVDPATFTAKGKVHTDFDGDGIVGFGDFLLFATAFGRSQGDIGFVANYDLDGDLTIGFSDFLIFSDTFGDSISSD